MKHEATLHFEHQTLDFASLIVLSLDLLSSQFLHLLFLPDTGQRPNQSLLTSPCGAAEVWQCLLFGGLLVCGLLDGLPLFLDTTLFTSSNDSAMARTKSSNFKLSPFFAQLCFCHYFFGSNVTYTTATHLHMEVVMPSILFACSTTCSVCQCDKEPTACQIYPHHSYSGCIPIL